MGRKSGKGSCSRTKRAKTWSSSQAPSSSSNPPPIYAFKFPNATHHHIFTRLLDRTLRRTKFYDPGTCNHLNIDSIVRQMAANLGLSDFLNICETTYDHLTLEFLITLTISREPKSGALAIQDRLFNQVRILSFDEVCDAFGMDYSAPCDAP